MAGMREIKARIIATKKTAQITKAMNMVSASKLRKAEKAIKSYRPLVEQMKEVIINLVSATDTIHPMLTEREVKKTAYVLISSDRGLAGPYNSSVLKTFQKYVDENHKSKDEYVVGTVGYKAYSYCKKRGIDLFNSEPIHVRDDVQFIDFQSVSRQLMSEYTEGNVDKIVVFYNHFINTISQEIYQEVLLPLPKLESNSKGEVENKLLYTYEPDEDEVINLVLPMYIENILYGIILDSKASEHAARMTAMKSATDNAEDIIDKLELHYNRARQSAITTELTDIVGGANAVN